MLRTLLSFLLIAASAMAGDAWQPVTHGLPIVGVGAQTLVADRTNPSTLYAISTRGLLFKSTDGSDSWKALSAATGVYSLLIDPKDSGVLYAGTSHGVLKSTDGGATWSGANVGLPAGWPAWAHVLAIDPGNSSILYVQKWDGIFRSADGGQSWNPLNAKFYSFAEAAIPLAGNSQITALVMDPAHASTMYAVVAGMMYALFKTTDGGATWYALDITGAGTGRTAGTVALDPATSVLYLTYFDFGGGGHIVKSADQGATWTSAGAGLSGALVDVLLVDPRNAGTVYGGYWQVSSSGAVRGLARSTDGGETWSIISTGLPGTYPFTSFAFDAQGALYASFYNGGTGIGGIFKSADGGASWHGANAGPTIVNVPALALDPSKPGVIYAAAGADGVYKSADRGANWNPLGAFQYQPDHFGVWPLSALSLAVDPRNSSLLYAWTASPFACVALDNLLFKSVDGGASWNTNASPPRNPCVVDGFLSVDPLDSNTLYVAESDDFDGGSWLRKTSDGGMNWSDIWQSDEGYLLALAIDPTASTTIYAGTSSGLLKSVDGGANWNDAGLRPGVNVLAVDSLRPNVVYAATTTDDYYPSPSGFAGLFKSVDAGASWSPINTGLETLNGKGSPVTALLVDPVNPGVVFAGTAGGGVFRSTDGGEHWVPLNSGLTDLDVRYLARSKDTGLLYASTSGGVFAIPAAAGSE
jgi:photosystem II stability/assembly factor-like uncharacterized protein